LIQEKKLFGTGVAKSFVNLGFSLRYEEFVFNIQASEC